MISFFLAAFFLQTTAVKFLAIGEFAPNLLLCGTMLLLLAYREQGTVMWLAALTALLQEICFSIYVGPGIAAVVLCSLTVILAGRIFTWDNLGFILTLTIFETIFYQLLVWGGGRFLGMPYSFWFVVERIPLYALCNLILMGVLYFIYVRKQKSRYCV